MKKSIILVAILMCIACIFGLTGCPNPDEGNPTVQNESAPQAESPETTEPGTTEPEVTRTLVTGKIGTYGAPYLVGDIVFEDDSATPFADITSRTEVDSETGTKLTQIERNGIVAFIFYKGTGLNNDDDTTTTRTLGALSTSRPGYFWSKGNAADVNIETVQCPAVGTPGNYTFSGTRNGKDNLNKISIYLEENNDVDLSVLGNHSAAFYKLYQNFYDAITCRDNCETYDTGWYLPSIAELYQIWKRKDSFAEILHMLDGISLEDYSVGSSSQNVDDATECDLLVFSDGSIWSASKNIDNAYLVIPIREFD